MIKIKDYAKETGVSYEAVRQRIERYKEELEGHIHRQGRTRYLDDVAVAFLNEHRLQEPTVLYDKGASDAFRQLQEDRDELDEQNRELLQELRSVYKELRDLQQFKLETEKEALRLETTKEAQERRERELQEREDGFTQELEAARQEASEAAQKAAEEKAAQDIDQAVQEANRVADERLEGVRNLHQQEVDTLRQQIQELEDRTLWDYLMAWFRKKKE